MKSSSVESLSSLLGSLFLWFAGLAVTVTALLLLAGNWMSNRGHQSVESDVAQIADVADVAGSPAAPQSKALPQTYRNSLGMEFVLVPKGTSWLGGGAGRSDEKEVEFKEDFYLGKYEVTQGEWEALTGANPSIFQRGGHGHKLVTEFSKEELNRFPVEMVSWDDAQRFVQGLNKHEQEAGWLY